MYNKGPYQVVPLGWLIWIFTVPIYPEDTFFLGAAQINNLSYLYVSYSCVQTEKEKWNHSSKSKIFWYANLKQFWTVSKKWKARPPSSQAARQHECKAGLGIWGLHISQRMTKPTKWYVHSVKAQLSLGICPVWSESSLYAWRKLGSLATHWVHSKDSDQIRWMPSLIRVFAVCRKKAWVLSYSLSAQQTDQTGHFVGFVMRWLIWDKNLFFPHCGKVINYQHTAKTDQTGHFVGFVMRWLIWDKNLFFPHCGKMINLLIIYCSYNKIKQEMSISSAY